MSSRPRIKLALLLLLLVVAGWLALDRLLAQQGIRGLAWQGLGVSGSGLSLQQLQFEQAGGHGSLLRISAEQLQLAWPHYVDGRLRWPALQGQRLKLFWLAGSAQPAADPLATLNLVTALPEQVDFANLELDLPCAAGRCTVQGELHLSHAVSLAQPLQLRATVQQDAWAAELNVDLREVAAQWQLKASVTLNQQPLLSLDSQLDKAPAGAAWRGNLQLAPVADTRELLLWWQQWLPTDQRLLAIQTSLQLQADWHLQLAEGATLLDPQRLLAASGEGHLSLQLRSPQLQQAKLKMDALALTLNLQARLQPEQLQLQALADSSVSIGKLHAAPSLILRTVRADLAGLELQASYSEGLLGELKLSGPLSLKVAKLMHLAVKPHAWQFKGKLDSTSVAQQLRGTLSNDGGLQLDLHAQRNEQGALELNAELPELFFRAGNPLQKTLSSWPALLSVNNGRLLGKARLRLATAESTPHLHLDAEFKGIDGIYDRSELQDLDGRLHVHVAGNNLLLKIPALNLGQVNAGLALGPLQFEGEYRAPLNRPLAGRMSWQRAQTKIFSGLAWLEPGQLELAQSPLRLPVQFKGVQLEEIFRVYPTEGLAGRGTLDGSLPFILDTKGLRIEKGNLAARAPGFLQFRSAKMEALGQSNPAMLQVTEALDNFQYSVLDSSVSYDENGKLKLALRLQGSNPQVQQGRPINLNINLEEDLGALITSLQLADQVSEVIRQRVQERLRHSNKTPAP